MGRDAVAIYGAYAEIDLDPDLKEIAEQSVLSLIAGSANFGCVSRGPSNNVCRDEFCANSTCVQAGCGINVSC